jgi:hypothetical protein
LKRGVNILSFDKIETADILDNNITNLKLAQTVGLTIKGNPTNIAGNVQDITASTDNTVLKRNGTSLIFGKILEADLNDSIITNQKIANVNSGTIKGRVSASSGPLEDLLPAQVKTLLSLENVNNTSDLNKPISTATQAALDTKIGGAIPTGRIIYGTGTGVTDSSNLV